MKRTAFGLGRLCAPAVLALSLMGAQCSGSSEGELREDISRLSAAQDFEQIAGIQQTFTRVYPPEPVATRLGEAYVRLGDTYEEGSPALMEDAVTDYLSVFEEPFSISALGPPTERSLRSVARAVEDINAALSASQGKAGNPALQGAVLRFIGLPIFLQVSDEDDSDRARRLQSCIRRCLREYRQCVRDGEENCSARRRSCIRRCQRRFGPEDPPRPDETEAEAAARRRQERIDELAPDPDQSGRVTEGSRRDAEVAVDLEEQGVLPGPIERPEPGDGHSGDFVDGEDQDWDVKRPRSRDRLIDEIRDRATQAGRPPPTFPPGQPVPGEFDLGETMEEIRRERAARERVIIDTSRMNDADRQRLRERVDQAVEDGDFGEGDVIFYP